MNSSPVTPKRRISILGSTGSIGCNTLDVMTHLGGREAFEVPAITGLGLSEAKALVEGAPKPLKEGVNKAEAEEIKGKIEAAGGTVELK